MVNVVAEKDTMEIAAKEVSINPNQTSEQSLSSNDLPAHYSLAEVQMFW